MEAVLPSCANPVNHIPVIEFAETHDVTTKQQLSRRNGQVPRENCEFLEDERAAEARAQSGAAWRASLKGASQCLSWGRVEFAPLLFIDSGEQLAIGFLERWVLNGGGRWGVQ
jgi:hypothetical protein